MAKFAFLVAGLVALVITALLGLIVIPLLKKLSFGQTINEIGPAWHKNKQGTPLMGGLMFIIGSTAGVFCALPMFGQTITDTDNNAPFVLYVAIITALLFSAVGFVDDYLKAIRKRNDGLSEWQKLAIQTIISVMFLLTLHNLGALSTWVNLPVVGTVDFGIFFYPISVVLIVGMVNAVNLTDGVDGLCTSVTLVAMCAYFILLTMLEKYHLSVWAAAMAGGCMGFLVWNFFPAKVFMGDTGSMFLGGVFVCIGYAMGHPELIIIVGAIYWLEALSVIIQRTYFKITKGKRIFKMSPIHHHFEMSGWSEIKIVIVFSFVTLVAGVLAFIYIHLLV